MKAIVLGLVLVLACGKSQDAGQLAADATAKMAAFGSARSDVKTWFPAAIEKLAATLPFDAAGAAKQLGDDVLPRLDRYLATAQAAMLASDAYVASGANVGDDTRAQLDRMRKGLAVMTELRATLESIRARLAQGPVTDKDLLELSTKLSGMGMKLLVAGD